MNNKDKIALTAALALVAGIIGFIVVKGDDGVTAAYYYLSIAPDADVNAVAREIKLCRMQPQDEAASFRGGRPAPATPASAQ